MDTTGLVTRAALQRELGQKGGSTAGGGRGPGSADISMGGVQDWHGRIPVGHTVNYQSWLLYQKKMLYT